MNTEKANDYLYKEFLKSFKNETWEVVERGDMIEVEGEDYDVKDVINVRSDNFKLVNKELNVYFYENLDQRELKEILKKEPNYFKFNIESSSYFLYWFVDHKRAKDDNWYSGYSTDYLYLNINWWQRMKLNKYFHRMLKNIYETRYEKTFAHAMDKYLKRNKAIMRDQRLDSILGDAGSESKEKQES